jgi:hypothetical protein
MVNIVKVGTIKGLDWRTIGLWLANLLLGLLGFMGMTLINNQKELKADQHSDRLILVEFMSRVNTMHADPRFTEKDFTNKMEARDLKNKEQDNRLSDHEQRLRRLEGRQ